MRAHERKPLARIGVSALCQLGYQPALQCRSYWWRPQPARRALALGQSMDASCDDLRRHLYKDNNGHPGTLLAQAALTSPSSAIRCIEVGPVKRVLRAALLACRVPGPPVPSTTRGAYRRMGPGNDSPPSSVPSTQIRSPEETARTRGGPPKPVPTTLTNLPTTSTTISPLRRGCGLRPWSGLSSPETRSRYCYALLRNHFSYGNCDEDTP